ncbi:glycerol-3-phosphate cytidylyltransferase [Candidatus Roizmanbacteria bacterium CG_4_10_14_0_8_um_filter_39_9]|uniref:Glycerol-3-phosphate cytidylyltransferase n=1 Tax=Candidatus Roizmanbacteria bacterium CG_4_10_14_0_8_um_filter_39_9 TaxID=1974829 RepID=A0A2M7QCV0_9BACT|nr:MAG: glycerol-3-phosphate cytidylyltransferase [Candidatus Roizmanbacteria bacterium CG_4_10_14_0_8_um_filter_39_9]
MEDTRIIAYKDIQSLPQRLTGKKIILVGGCFDVFHIGHLTFLSRAKQLGDVLVVLLESDDFIRKVKKREPVHRIEERALILSELRCVDLVITLPHMIDNHDYEEIIRKIHPTIIAVTQGDPKLILKQNQAKTINGFVVEVDYVPGYSSSEVRALF